MSQEPECWGTQCLRMPPWRLRPARAVAPQQRATDTTNAIHKATKATHKQPTPGPSRSAGRPPSSPTAQAGRRRQPQKQGCVVGGVQETRQDHLTRHGGGQRTCPRCRWYKHGDFWTCSYGKLYSQLHSGPRENVLWLAERPVRWGGEWGLGCSICAWFANRATVTGPCHTPPSASSTQPQRGSQRLCRLGTRFARFEVRAEFLQAEHIKQHAESSAHRTGRLIIVIVWQDRGTIWRWETSIRSKESFLRPQNLRNSRINWSQQNTAARKHPA